MIDEPWMRKKMGFFSGGPSVGNSSWTGLESNEKPSFKIL